ncbi:MAG: hypothetical protein ACM3S1_16360 [Hyphomicrobiales bacterium]
MPSLTESYHLDAAPAGLERLVDRIEDNPGRLIRPGELDTLAEHVDVRAVLANLPSGMSEGDFAGAVRLALLTECATESYARVFEDASARYGAPWLGRFIHNVWTPDELTHHAPFKLLLMQAGFLEGELDAAVRETQDRPYLHESGLTPAHLTAFGMVQEYLTDNWHGLIAGLLRQHAREAAIMVSRIKQRETLHTTWYRDMTALQLEANPRLLTHVGEAIANFKMPGNSLVPELQDQAPIWMERMGADFDRILRDLVRLVATAAGDARSTGRLLLQIAAARGERVGPFSARHLALALGRLGGPAHGLIGEALLERLGLGYLFPQPGASRRADERIVRRLRALLRGWIRDRIELELGPPPRPALSEA